MLYVLFVLSVFGFSTSMTLSVVDRADETGWSIAGACVLINALMDFAAVMMAVDEWQADE